MDTNKIQTAILLIRNPLDMLPSYFKFLYRHEFGNGVAAEVPIDKWVAWRNEHYMEQLEKWVEHTKWWMDNYSGRIMILPFEKLTDPDEGWIVLKNIGIFLSQVDTPEGTVTKNLVPEADLPCLWDLMIGQTVPPDSILGKVMADNAGKKLSKNQRRAALKNANPPYPFTIDQMDEMMKVLKNVKKTYNQVPQIHDAMAQYIRAITVAKKKVEKLLSQ